MGVIRTQSGPIIQAKLKGNFGSLGQYYCDIANAMSDILLRLSLRGFDKSRRTGSPLRDRYPLYFVYVVLIYSTPGLPYLPFTDGNTEEG